MHQSPTNKHSDFLHSFAVTMLYYITKYMYMVTYIDIQHICRIHSWKSNFRVKNGCVDNLLDIFK